MNALRAVQELKIDDPGAYLCIPRSKRQEIYTQFPNEPQQREQLVKYWTERDPRASWRSVIATLDMLGMKKAADSIRHLAEPVIGRTDIAKGSVQKHDAML